MGKFKYCSSTVDSVRISTLFILYFLFYFVIYVQFRLMWIFLPVTVMSFICFNCISLSCVFKPCLWLSLCTSSLSCLVNCVLCMIGLCYLFPVCPVCLNLLPVFRPLLHPKINNLICKHCSSVCLFLLHLGPSTSALYRTIWPCWTQQWKRFSFMFLPPREGVSMSCNGHSLVWVPEPSLCQSGASRDTPDQTNHILPRLHKSQAHWFCYCGFTSSSTESVNPAARTQGTLHWEVWWFSCLIVCSLTFEVQPFTFVMEWSEVAFIMINFTWCDHEWATVGWERCSWSVLLRLLFLLLWHGFWANLLWPRKQPILLVSSENPVSHMEWGTCWHLLPQVLRRD